MDDSSGYAALAALSIAYLAFLGVVVLVAIASYVAWGFTLGSLFRKVGIEPWIAWVPVYNRWKLLELGGHQGWLSLLAFVSGGDIVAAVFTYIGMYRTGIAFGKDGTFVVLGIFLPWVWAYFLGRPTEVYRPEVFAQRGWTPPLAGYGAVPAAI